jgi:hypothetical protein
MFAAPDVPIGGLDAEQFAGLLGSVVEVLGGESGKREGHAGESLV